MPDEKPLHLTAARLAVAIYRVINDSKSQENGADFAELEFTFTEYDVDLINDVVWEMVEYGALIAEKRGDDDYFTVAPDAD
jgi:hypothetical protein